MTAPTPAMVRSSNNPPTTKIVSTQIDARPAGVGPDGGEVEGGVDVVVGGDTGVAGVIGGVFGGGAPPMLPPGVLAGGPDMPGRFAGFDGGAYGLFGMPVRLSQPPSSVGPCIRCRAFSC